jgi:hypothetical protein
VIRLGSRDIYLGKHGSAASREAYKLVVAEWSLSGGAASTPATTITVSEVILAYLKSALGYFMRTVKLLSSPEFAKR